MTPQQKNWLDSNLDYRPLGQPGGNTRWVGTGTLKPDGAFVPATKRNPVPGIGTPNGAFGVGKLVTFTPGQPMAADDPALSGQKPTPPGLRRAARRMDDEPVEEPQPSDPRDYLTNWNKGGGGLPSQGEGQKR